MKRLAVAAVALLTFAMVGCGQDEPKAAINVADAEAVLVSTDADTRVLEVSATVTSGRDDELRSASVTPAVGSKVTVAAYAGSSGGDGHLGHLDPDVGGSHTHGGRLAIDLPAGRPVLIGPGGVAQVRVRDLVAEPAPGAEFDLTLDFETSPDVVVAVTVAE